MAESEEGTRKSLVLQVTDVNEALLSVHKIVKNGRRVVFQDEDSYVEDRSAGERMALREGGGTWGMEDGDIGV